VASDDVYVREARPGDGDAIAQMHIENAAYYHSLSPESFRLPHEDGLSAFVEPTREANSETRLELVAEVDGNVAGHLAAHLIEPDEAARFQMVRYLASRRLWIDSLGTLQRCWRRGVGSVLVEAAEAWGRERGAVVSMCDTWLGSPVSLPFWESRMGYDRRAVILEKPL
jgi:GNAT superfamily N-acetyltransferase